MPSSGIDGNQPPFNQIH